VDVLTDMGEPPRSLDSPLSADAVELAASEFNVVVERVVHAGASGQLEPRAAVVAVMGHVDHGKTTLLDYLRKANVAASEAGGITQHIGAFSVQLEELGSSLTFLDTPGHAAFKEMRARGARVTDLVVLVVAADDGVMPQTMEALQHARQAGVVVVVAITKCDKPGVDIARVKKQLLEAEVELEEVGGNVPVVEVSGVTGAGMSELQQTLGLQAEALQLRARVDCDAEGVVVDARKDAGRGPLATLLITRGCLKVLPYPIISPSHPIPSSSTVLRMCCTSEAALRHIGMGPRR
jgi:translation initiation factor IF-2